MGHGARYKVQGHNTYPWLGPNLLNLCLKYSHTHRIFTPLTRELRCWLCGSSCCHIHGPLLPHLGARAFCLLCARRCLRNMNYKWDLNKLTHAHAGGTFMENNCLTSSIRPGKVESQQPEKELKLEKEEEEKESCSLDASLRCIYLSLCTLNSMYNALACTLQDLQDL